MFPFVLLILLSSVIQQASGLSVQASETRYNNKTDRDTLLALKASISNQWGALASWNANTDFCRWQGVSCSLKHKQRVVELNLSSQGLAGTVTPSIGNLTFLKILDLSANNLHGTIPSETGYLFQLRYLDLSNNTLHGNVNANLRNCTNLEGINLDSNRLTGEIPAWLGGLSNLKAIYLQNNNFSGMIPPSLANLSALQEILFTYNQLEGSIPEGLGSINSLEILALGGNQLSGTVPTKLFNLSSLTRFSITWNKLHGTLPYDLGNRLYKLQHFRIGLNHFTGRLPASFANATQIYTLDISTNKLTGKVPPEIGKLCPGFLSLERNQLVATTTQDWEFMTLMKNCTRLRIFAIDNNRLGGMLPSSVANLSAQLQLLFLGFNEISGKIPLGISNLVGLNKLQLSNNRFTGKLPDSIGRLSSLQLLGIENNQFTGSIPSTIGNLTQLQDLVTGNNMLGGPLPRSLGSLQKLIFASFYNNKFSGPLPVEIFNVSTLSDALDLSANNFGGPLPPEIGSLTMLAYLNISRNNLSGPLPNELSNCQSLTGLYLDRNHFNGSIPASISQMRGLESLSLTENTLSGEIPQEIGQMPGMKVLCLSHNMLSGNIPESFQNMTSLYQLDLSFNHLEGKVPSHGPFSDVTGLSLEGNTGLCGGIPKLHLPPCLEKNMEQRKSKHWFIIKVIVPISGIVLCFSLVLISISLRKKQKSQSMAVAGFHLTDDQYPRVSYAELVQGTNGFDMNNLIGTGRYGSVYKCSLLIKSAITVVAVKVFDLQQSGSSKSFIAECQTLSKIRHRNLISIITCCLSADSNQHDFKALVFEFMPNGSLHSWLYRDVHSSPQQQGLTLIQRLNIVVDVADALDYLHNNGEQPIVHCDLKPSNILLDEDLVAHVGDFGLAKILSDSASKPMINSKSTVGIRGTIGYVAPEYGEGGQVSPCGDVYSFGIVILELFTGMAPTHDMFRDGLTLQKHAENAFPGTLMKIVDPVLLSAEEAYASNLQGGRNAMEDISKVMLSITNLALSCSKQAPTDRMCMRDAAAEMHKTRDCYVKRRQGEEANEC